MGVVATAGGDDHDAVLGDAAQRRLRAGEPASVPPGGEGGDVLMHRRRKGSRPAVLGQLALDEGDLTDGCAVAAELSGHGDRQQAFIADVLERLVHPGAVPVVTSRVLDKGRPAGGGSFDECAIDFRTAVDGRWRFGDGHGDSL